MDTELQHISGSYTLSLLSPSLRYVYHLTKLKLFYQLGKQVVRVKIKIFNLKKNWIASYLY